MYNTDAFLQDKVKKKQKTIYNSHFTSFTSLNMKFDTKWLFVHIS